MRSFVLTFFFFLDIKWIITDRLDIYYSILKLTALAQMHQLNLNNPFSLTSLANFHNDLVYIETLYPY